jgi:hypothetical protein
MIKLFKKHERGLGSAFVFMVFFASTINHSSANLSFALNVETSDYDTYVARACSSLKGMSFLCLAGDIVDWQ